MVLLYIRILLVVGGGCVPKGTSILREKNKRKVLSFIRELGQTSRKDLVSLMNVSKNTISLIVDEYISEGVLKEVGIKEKEKKGRPKILIKINKNYYRAIGIGISRNRIDVTIIDYYGEIIEQSTINYDNTNSDKTIEMLQEIIDKFVKKYDNLLGIGIGIPGIIDTNQQYLYTSTHLGWKDVDLSLLTNYEPPIYIHNSVNMGAVDAIDGMNNKNIKSVFYMRISEGVGGSYVIDHSIVSGDSWSAGEIGHISVSSTGMKCRCGQYGCLESLVNYDALKKDLKEENIDFDKDGIALLSSVPSDKLDSILRKYGDYLGKALIKVIHLMNPGYIIIDSPYNQFDEFEKACVHYLEKHALPLSYHDTIITFKRKRYEMSKGAALFTIMTFEQEYN